VVRAGFHQLAIPNGFAVGSGESAWYKLRSIDPGNDPAAPLDFAIVGVRAELCACDVDAAGGGGISAANAAAWGDTRGMLAAIVVGRSLPGRLNAWSSAPAYIPGIDTGGPGGLLIPTQAPDYIYKTGFPSGKWSDTTPGKGIASWSFAPDQVVFPSGAGSLDISLVVQGSQIQTAASKTLVGMADVSIMLRLSEDRYRLRKGG